jgi:hypothetical protein
VSKKKPLDPKAPHKCPGKAKKKARTAIGRLEEKADLLIDLHNHFGERIMEALQSYAGRVKDFATKIGSSIDGVKGDLESVKAKLEEIQNSPGRISPEDQASLDEALAALEGVTTRIADLDAATEPAVIPTPNP